MSKLTVDECKRIILQGKKQLTAAEQRIAELEANNSTRWFELFGTPEKAARTLAGKCSDCCECVIADYCEYGSGEGCLLMSYAGNHDALLEWLKGDSDDEKETMLP